MISTFGIEVAMDLVIGVPTGVGAFIGQVLCGKGRGRG